MEMSYALESVVPSIVNDSAVDLPLNFSVLYVSGRQIPREYRNLRHEIYCIETNFLPDDQLFDGNDAGAEHVLIYDGGELVAATSCTPIGKSDFAHHSGIASQELQGCFYSSRSCVAKPYRRKGLFALLVYLAMRRNRQAGLDSWVAYVEPGDIPAKKVLHYDYPRAAKPRQIIGTNGKIYEVVACLGSIHESMIRTFNAMPQDLQNWVRTHCFVDEIAVHVTQKVKQFYACRYFEAVRQGRLSRRQYLASISNKHHFVRWTTRILGSAVAMCDDPDLRRHYAAHLSGEINHELWLENDIRYLGGDLAFLLNQTVTDPGVLNFQFIQEALTHCRRDPIVFLGVPIAIEGISGFLDTAFIEGLKGCIRSWGYDEPSKGCTFYASHVHTDGADEGHWVGTLRVIARVVRNEQQLQLILNIVSLVVDALHRAYDHYMNQPGCALDAAALGDIPSEKTSLN